MPFNTSFFDGTDKLKLIESSEFFAVIFYERGRAGVDFHNSGVLKVRVIKNKMPTENF